MTSLDVLELPAPSSSSLWLSYMKPSLQFGPLLLPDANQNMGVSWIKGQQDKPSLPRV